MDFLEYQEKAWGTAIYPNKGENIYYPALGLGGESGEVLEKIKKTMRDKNSEIDEQTKKDLIKELGDVLWYISSLAREIGTDINEIAEANVKKLELRKEKGTLHGEGDNR